MRLHGLVVRKAQSRSASLGDIARRPRIITLGLFASLVALASLLAANPLSASAADLRPAGQVSAATAPAFGHVFVIVGENKSLYQLNSSNAPYIMNTLKPESAWMTNYNDVTPGSLADYVALTSGQFAPCQTGGPCGAQNVPSIFSQLGDGAWKDWNESMPSNCYPTVAGSESTLNAYKQGHNPALYYAGLPCSTYDVPAGTTGPDDMSYFNNALAAGNVPEYNLVSPNLCEDSYHSCNGVNIVTEYDNFLKKEIPLIEASPAFGSNGVIFATYDEGYVPTHNPNTMMDVIGPQVQVGTYSGDYDHYSTLATIEQGLGLPCLANACTASALSVFGNVPPSPSVSISQPAADSTVAGTVTVSGTAAETGATISQVQVSVDGGTPVTATGTTSWSTSIDTTALADGTHTINVQATDTDGNVGTANVTVTVSNTSTVTSCPATPAGTTELSGNLSLETSQTGWTGIYNSNSVPARVKPAGGSYDGSWALQVAPKNAGAAGVNNANPIWVPGAPGAATTAGHVYTGSAFVAASTTGEKVTLVVRETTPQGTSVSSHATTVTLGDTGWHQITSAYTAEATGDLIRYSLYASNFASSGQHFLADCMSLQTP
jgi:phosphatidylinositol-3-phosphatase